MAFDEPASPNGQKKKKIANLPSKMRSNVGNIHPLWEAGIFHLSVLFPGPIGTNWHQTHTKNVCFLQLTAAKLETP